MMSVQMWATMETWREKGVELPRDQKMLISSSLAVGEIKDSLGNDSTPLMV